MKSLEEYVAMAHRVRLKELRESPVEDKSDVENKVPLKPPTILTKAQQPPIPRTGSDDIESAYQSLTTYLKETFPIWSAYSPYNKVIAGAAIRMDALREKSDTIPLQDTIIEIEKMLLKVFADDFSKKNHAVKIHSSVLSEEVWIVSNEQTRAHIAAEGLACYLPGELIHLKNNPPAGIRAIHTIKKGLGGSTRVIE